MTLVAAVWMPAYARASKPCSEVTNIGPALSSWAVFWLDFVKIKMQWVDLRNRIKVLCSLGRLHSNLVLRSQI